MTLIGLTPTSIIFMVHLDNKQHKEAPKKDTHFLCILFDSSFYSTVTDLAKFLGLSTSQPLILAV